MNTKTTKPTIDDIYKENPVKACRMALKRTAHLNTQTSPSRMTAINSLLRGYGIESIKGDWQDGWWCDIVADYVNMGDTYNTTVMMVREDYGNGANYIVSTFGDFVEKNTKKYGIY